MKILDTDILVGILRGKKNEEDLLNYLKNENIAISIITAFELYYGAFKSERASENLKEVDRLLSSYPVINFDKDASKEAGKIYSSLGFAVARDISSYNSEIEKKELGIEIRDVMIGAICIVNDASLITSNVKHYSRIEGLRIEKW